MFALRVRSWYSFLQGTSSPRELCIRAKTLGYSGLALTDRDNIYGLWEFIRHCKAQKLQPIIGAEVSAQESGSLITCLVKNETGYKNLCRMLTRRHMASGHSRFDLFSEIPHFAAGLILLCNDLNSLRHCLDHGLCAVADLGPSPTAQAKALYTWTKKNGLVAVATPDADLGHTGEREVHQVVQAIKEGWTISTARRESKDVHALLPPQVYADRFAIWPGVVEAADSLAKQCPYTGPSGQVIMPPWKHDQGKEETDALTTLRTRAFQGAARKYGQDLGEEVVERLEHELRIIEEKGFSSYFLVVDDIVHHTTQKSRGAERLRRRICGRGSGAASLVAYCLGITNVCPIKYNLYFERFLNPGRTDPPDIDIDFSWDERDQVLDEVLHTYAGHAAMVCNHVFFQPRMAIREVAKVYGIPGYEISKRTKRIPGGYGTGEDLAGQLVKLPTFKDQDLSPPWPEILALAEQIIGFPRHLSVHSGGVVITPDPIDEYVVVERAAKGVPIIQWEKDGAEEAGLVKIDLLGNRSLGVIRDTISTVESECLARGETTDEFIEEHWQPEDDIQTRNLVAQGQTMGCFYIESPAMRLLEQKAATGDFEQIVIQSSIIRPAANDFVREYVRRLHGGTWVPLCPEIKDVLDETFGLMVYQEDVSKVAVALAGFSHAEADGLRKVMSKKNKELRLRDYKQDFFAGCRAKGIAQKDMNQIWQMMMSFEGYSFCKPHSASYARVSFQAAYLKCHYPAQFMAAVLSNQGGYYTAFAYVSEAKRLGLEVQHPDVSKSQVHWTGTGNTLRVGLQAVKGLSAACRERILTQRAENSYVSLVDFFRRVQPTDNEILALACAGALDSLAANLNRPMILWQWTHFQRLRQEMQTMSLFEVVLPDPPQLAAPELLDTLRREYAVLGFLCQYHPLQFVRTRRGEKGLVPVSTLEQRVGQRVRCAAWLLTGKLVSTHRGEAMEFLTFEDESAQIETTFFPQTYRKYARMLKSGRGYLLTGLVEEDYGALTLTVDAVCPL
ncbi:MAG: DNA polymerase III subunit alpha [Desulfobulbus propionicus]|nr:MAG: DNA polymerase III subunit alpha [Desulfobulbus propionicus]